MATRTTRTTRRAMTQKEKIVNFFTRNNPTGSKRMTATDARRLGITSLSSRISELKNDGYQIWSDTRVVNGRRVASYRLDLDRSSVE